jgi:hypothetical protein
VKLYRCFTVDNFIMMKYTCYSSCICDQIYVSLELYIIMMKLYIYEVSYGEEGREGLAYQVTFATDEGE